MTLIVTFDLHLKNFNVGHNYCTVKDWAFKFDMCVPCDNVFPLKNAPSGALPDLVSALVIEMYSPQAYRIVVNLSLIMTLTFRFDLDLGR